MTLKQGLLIFFITSNGQAFWSKEDLRAIFQEAHGRYSQKTHADVADVLPNQAYQKFFINQNIADLFIWGENLVLTQEVLENETPNTFNRDQNDTYLSAKTFFKSMASDGYTLTPQQQTHSFTKTQSLLKELYQVLREKKPFEIQPIQQRTSLRLIFNAELCAFNQKLERVKKALDWAEEITPEPIKAPVQIAGSVLKTHYEKMYTLLSFRVRDLILFDDAFIQNQKRAAESEKSTFDALDRGVKQVASFDDIQNWAEKIMTATRHQHTLYQQVCRVKGDLNRQRQARGETGFCLPFVQTIDRLLSNQSPPYAFEFIHFSKMASDFIVETGLRLARPGQILLQQHTQSMKTDFLKDIPDTQAHFVGKLSFLVVEALKILGKKSTHLNHLLTLYDFGTDQNHVQIDESFFDHLLSPKNQSEITAKTTALADLLQVQAWDWSFLEGRLFIFPTIFYQLMQIYHQNPQFAWNLLSEWGVRTVSPSENLGHRADQQKERVASSFLLLAETLRSEPVFLEENKSCLDAFIFEFCQHLALTSPLYKEKNSFNRALLFLEEEIQSLFKTLFQTSKIEGQDLKQKKEHYSVFQATQYTLNFLSSGIMPLIPNFDPGAVHQNKDDVLLEKEASLQTHEISMIQNSFEWAKQNLRKTFVQNAQNKGEEKRSLSEKNLFRKIIIDAFSLSPDEKSPHDSSNKQRFFMIQKAFQKLYPSSFSLSQEFARLKTAFDTPYCAQQNNYQSKYFLVYRNKWFLNREGVEKLLSALKVIE